MVPRSGLSLKFERGNLRGLLGDLSKVEPWLRDVEEVLSRIANLRRESIFVSKKRTQKDGIDGLLNSVLHRSIELSQGIIICVNAGCIGSTLCLVRAHMEVAAQLMWLAHELFLRDGSPTETRKSVLQAFLGTRDVELKNEGEPWFSTAINVLTFMDAADTLLGKGSLRKPYESLCELVHPNAEANLLYARVMKNKRGSVFGTTFAFSNHMLTTALLNLRRSLRAFEAAWEILQSKVRSL